MKTVTWINYGNRETLATLIQEVDSSFALAKDNEIGKRALDIRLVDSNDYFEPDHQSFRIVLDSEKYQTPTINYYTVYDISHKQIKVDGNFFVTTSAFKGGAGYRIPIYELFPDYVQPISFKVSMKDLSGSFSRLGMSYEEFVKLYKTVLKYTGSGDGHVGLNEPYVFEGKTTENNFNVFTMSTIPVLYYIQDCTPIPKFPHEYLDDAINNPSSFEDTGYDENEHVYDIKQYINKLKEVMVHIAEGVTVEQY